jgi:hypothetical protein
MCGTSSRETVAVPRIAGELAQGPTSPRSLPKKVFVASGLADARREDFHPEAAV